MSKKDFIALADAIKWDGRFGPGHIETLAEFCYSRNKAFNGNRWLAYIEGKCGPNGGKVK